MLGQQHRLWAAILLGSVLLGGPVRAGDPDAAYGALLGRYVLAYPDGVNRVDYAGWSRSQGDRRRLDRYISELQRRTPSQMVRNQAFAYWVNLYNAVTLKVVLDRYPVTSIRDIKSDSYFDPKAYLGPWRTKRVTVEGRQLSLDDIEHGVLRATYKDPRIHYAVNCASVGCPNLMRRPWSGHTLEADLNAAATAYINHPRGVTVVAPGQLKLSSIYQWFADDFGANEVAVIAHLRKYASPKLAKRLAGAAVTAYHYDWSLNRR